MEGWTQRTIEEAFHIDYGTRITRKKDNGTLFPVYGGGGETFRTDNFNREDCVVIARFGISERCTRFVPGKFFLNDSGLTLRPRKDGLLDENFLRYLVLAQNDAIYELGRGTAQKNLDVPALRNLRIRFPSSLPEQERIVAILDEAFAAIETATANTEKNLANARELLQSQLEKVFARDAVVERWSLSPLQDLCSLQNGRAFKKAEWSSDGLPIIRIQNLNNSEAPFNFFRGDYDQRIEVRRGDLLFSWSGTVGSSFGPHIWDRGTGVLNQHIFKVSINSRVNKHFAYYALRHITTEIERNVIGAVGLVHITKSKLQKFPIPLPPLLDQKGIVAILDKASEDSATLLRLGELKLALLADLKQSLLQQAFTGRLTSISKTADRLLSETSV
jgi:type I restriction enzyme S subunit